MAFDIDTDNRTWAEFEAKNRRENQAFFDVRNERQRAERFHPETTDAPDGTGGGGRDTWRTIAQHSCDRATREHQLTFAHVLDEETAEVLAETDPAKLRKELVQVMAVCLRWIDKLDREAGR
jgi:hypothetical protein